MRQYWTWVPGTPKSDSYIMAYKSKRRSGTVLSWSVHQWPLRVITWEEQISPQSPVCKQNSSHLHSFCLGILFNCAALGIHLRKTSQFYILKTWFGGETYSSDVNVPKGHYKIAKALFGIGIHFFIDSPKFGVGRLVLYFKVRTLTLNPMEVYLAVFWPRARFTVQTCESGL